MREREERFAARTEGVSRPTSLGADAVMRVLRVPPELAGMRLDRYVQTQLRSTSRTRTQRIVGLGAFSPEGVALKKNHRVRAEERIALWREAWDEAFTDVEIPVIFEDDALVAVNKPPHVAVHPTARHNRSTVTSLLAVQRPNDRLTLLHRIDRETSGVLLLARTRAAGLPAAVMVSPVASISSHGPRAMGWVARSTPCTPRWVCSDCAAAAAAGNEASAVATAAGAAGEPTRREILP